MDWLIGAARRPDYFGAVVDSSAGAFRVVLSRSGRVVPVAGGQSIVAALSEVGIAVAVSGEQWVCGTCLCNVLEGVPDHRNNDMTAEEKAWNDQMTHCCSRAKTPQLVLDL
jgi:vanillate O-demethylase ferredoxin subunit